MTNFIRAVYFIKILAIIGYFIGNVSFAGKRADENEYVYRNIDTVSSDLLFHQIILVCLYVYHIAFHPTMMMCASQLQDKSVQK